MKKHMALGSIVLLKGGTQKVLIISRAINVKKDDSVFFFDYGGVPYPDGLISDQIGYFNHDNISKVVFEGYRDIDDENMIENIERYIDENPNIVKGDPRTW